MWKSIVKLAICGFLIPNRCAREKIRRLGSKNHCIDVRVQAGIGSQNQLASPCAPPQPSRSPYRAAYGP